MIQSLNLMLLVYDKKYIIVHFIMSKRIEISYTFLFEMIM